MKLIVGLGNIGHEYADHRHNIGFRIVDLWALNNKKVFRTRPLYDFCETGAAMIIKPRTYMNRSGEAVFDAVERIGSAEVLVISDDIYLPVGLIRLRERGSDGGHNGLKSIIQCLGTNAFKRMRIGVGTPGDEVLSDHVLSPFSGEEKEHVETAVRWAAEIVDAYINGDFQDALSCHSRLKNPIPGS